MPNLFKSLKKLKCFFKLSCCINIEIDNTDSHIDSQKKSSNE